MGGKPSASRHGSEEESGMPDKSGSSRLRLHRAGGSRGGGGSQHKFLKEDQFSGIAKLQLNSVGPHSNFSRILGLGLQFALVQNPCGNNIQNLTTLGWCFNQPGG